MMEKSNCLIAQSGGPTAAINASLAGTFHGAYTTDTHIDRIYGGINGIQGILEEKIMDLTDILSHDDNLDILCGTPSSSLGSCRYKLKDASENPEDYEKLFKIFEKYNIKFFFYIGGNDSMDTVYNLNKYAISNNHNVCIMGIPKTIDNDLVETDHTPGFGSAAKYIVTTVKELYMDTIVYDKKSLLIVEVMGRDAGWLALSSSLAEVKINKNSVPAVDLIYLPEFPFSMEKYLSDVKELLAKKNQVIVVVSEGIKDENGTYISELYKNNDDSKVDVFGHVQLGGTGKCLENISVNEFNISTRCIELSTIQRCASHVASKTDIDESFKIGEFVVKTGISGMSRIALTNVTENNPSGKMGCFKRVGAAPYKSAFVLCDTANIANNAKLVPSEYMNEEKNQASDDAKNYLKPLIRGDVEIISKDGQPEHLILHKIYKHTKKE